MEFFSYNMKLIIKWINILDVSSGNATKCLVQQVHTRQRGIISEAEYSSRPDKVVYGLSELDYNSDTIVAGANLCILHYTGKLCDVSTYRGDYKSIKGVTIAHA